MTLVPAVLFIVLCTAGTVAGVVWLTPWVLSWLSGPEDWWRTAAEWLVRLIMYVASLFIGIWTALLLAPPLSGPALERLVLIQERELLIPERAPSNFIAEVVCGLRAQLFAVCFAAPVVLGLWFLELMFPPAVVLTKPLQAVVTALAIAWNLFDYPLTLRGVSASDRLGFVASHWQPVLGFGLAFVPLFWVPCVGVLMLPAGVVAATRLLYQLLEREPEELPQLPRPRPELAAAGENFGPLGQESLNTADNSSIR